LICETIFAGYQYPVAVVKKQPEPRLVEWLDAQDVESLFLSVAALGEIRKGLTIFPAGKP
jgi:hypothetical protein